MLAQHNIIAGHRTSALHVEQKRRQRSDMQEQQELFTDYTHMKTEQERNRRARVRETEERLADELSRQAAEKAREAMNRQRICEGSEEIRVLKERLNAAKMNKERARQLAEIDLQREDELAHEQQLAAHMEAERCENQALEHMLGIEKRRQREHVKQVNLQQIAFKEDQRQVELDEHLKDKVLVQDIVTKIMQEDEMEFRAQKQKQEEAHRQMSQFLQDQKARCKKAEMENIEENRKIEHFQREKDRKEELSAARKVAAQREKERVAATIISKLEKESRAAKAIEQLRNSLHEEEVEADYRCRENAQAMKRLSNRERMNKIYVEQMAEKARQTEKRQQEEDEFRKNLMEKFAKDDHIELISEQKRRMKIEEHKREAQRLIEVRRAIDEQQRAEEWAKEEQFRQEELRRQVVIEEERRRILQEEAPDLFEFLPKGSLDRHADLALLFPDGQALKHMTGVFAS